MKATRALLVAKLFRGSGQEVERLCVSRTEARALVGLVISYRSLVYAKRRWLQVAISPAVPHPETERRITTTQFEIKRTVNQSLQAFSKFDFRCRISAVFILLTPSGSEGVFFLHGTD